jgi:fructose-1,6-bisphosphatase/inositol monophosphatase family enzyme
MVYLKNLQQQLEERTLPLITAVPQSWTKSDGSVVTSVDLAIQTEIVRTIEQQYPSHRILYEEGEPQHLAKKSDFTWVIDPIDGTANFLAGKKEYSIAIGLMQGNTFIEALVIFPAYQESFYAGKDQGICCNGHQITPPKPNFDNREIIFCSRTYPQAQARIRDYQPTFYRCATYSLLRVLKGEALAFRAAHTMLYDVGPMAHIVREAGIECLSGVGCRLSYQPNLNRIPSFLAVSSRTSEALQYAILEIPSKSK